ncbi:Zinc finger SWIM-type [Penicillium samsonianum]|uniref:Zinc finger SWIM-type n=1 Tax=Penicillium samsonianum TaxID=1882272 RepID=UPI00254818DF|nr:Zinc finger SWIM-type [Penicillium samsonianum]KAJ6128337.1 Zinc finger SWIM-type [Penicillium samsonianum]
MDSNSPHIFIDRLITELAGQPAGGHSKTLKPLMLTLHCLFPNDFLPALDILDRKLVRPIVRSDRCPTSPETAQEDIFIVISASVPPSLPGSLTLSQEKGYEVRLRAWNCSCPTFTLSAYRDSQLPANHPTNEQNQAYSFGGTLARGTARVSPPTCKHILACILHARCPELFGVDRDGKFAVSKEELAGWCAGWGG